MGLPELSNYEGLPSRAGGSPFCTSACAGTARTLEKKPSELAAFCLIAVLGTLIRLLKTIGSRLIAG